MRKSISLVANVVCVVLLCIGIPALAEKNDDLCCEEEGIDSSSWELLPAGLMRLLKNSLPDLHLTVTSPGWETTDGLEQLRTVVKPTLGALGMKVKDIEDLLTRIDLYAASVPLEAKDGVNMAFRLVGSSLLTHFTAVEVMRDGADTMFEAYSLLHSESYPGALASYRECLDSSIEKMGTKTRLAIGDWIDRIEKESKEFDISTKNLLAHSDIAQKFIGIVHGDPTLSPQRVCYAEHLQFVYEN